MFIFVLMCVCTCVCFSFPNQSCFDPRKANAQHSIPMSTAAKPHICFSPPLLA